MLERLRSLTENRRFLNRLRAGMPPADSRRMERVISGARLFFAVVALIAIWLDPTEPARYEELIYGLLIVYVVHSLVVHLFAWFYSKTTHPAWAALQVVDIAWFSIITTFSQGPNSPLYVFLLFLLLVAGFQWGFRETVATAATIVAVLFTQGVLLLAAPFMGRYGLEGAFELNRFILRGAFLLLMGLLLGYLSEQEKMHQAEASLIARLLGQVQAERGLRSAVAAVSGEVLRILSAERALAVLQEGSSGRVYLWAAHRHRGNDVVSLHLSEPETDSSQAYFFPMRAQALFAFRRKSARTGRGAFRSIALDAEGHREAVKTLEFPEEFLAERAFRSAVIVSLEFASEWNGRLIVFDPEPGRNPETELRFLQKLLREVGPALHSVYLVRRLRSRVGAVERARVARELHDGAIQSLVGLEMQLDVLRRPGSPDPEHLGLKLSVMQNLLHQEVLNLRDLMEQIKPVSTGPRQLVEHLTDMVEKFRRETGIASSFECSEAEITLSARAARETSRIVQEALVNIRKHSAARNVVVRLLARDSCWELTIDDDGRGFDFAGRLSLAELDAARKGPVVIKERVRALGAELTVDSRPGEGARLEISIPQRSHA